MYRLTDALPYLLNRVGVRMGDLFARRLEGYGLTLPMYRVMAALWERGDRRLGELGEVASIEVSTLSRLVGTLSRRGLVSRCRPDDNARAVAINLTAKGRVLTERLIPLAAQYETAGLRGLDPHEVAELKRSLAKVYENLAVLEQELATAAPHDQPPAAPRHGQALQRSRRPHRPAPDRPDPPRDSRRTPRGT